MALSTDRSGTSSRLPTLCPVRPIDASNAEPRSLIDKTYHCPQPLLLCEAAAFALWSMAIGASFDGSLSNIAHVRKHTVIWWAGDK